MYETIELNQRTSYKEIVLNRPDKLNALSEQMVYDLHHALEKISVDTPEKILLIRGNGSSFCSGHDLSEPVDVTDEKKMFNYLNKMQDITKLIVNHKAPTVAAIQGHAIGAGFEIALNCDLVYASENTSISLPELKVGLSITQGSSYFLPKRVGLKKAKEILFFGDAIEANEAASLGLINDVYPEAELLEKVKERLGILQERSVGPLSAVKKLLHDGYDGTLEKSLQNEMNTLINLYS